MTRFHRLLGLAFLLSISLRAEAQSLVVVDVRGLDLKPGARVEEGLAVTVPPGGKLVLVRKDGRLISLRGPFKGPIKGPTGQTQSATRALAALVATRNDRANRIGAVRSGANAEPLPSPWLIDVSRPGERCLVEGSPITWWRPRSAAQETFTLFPLDRSWKADFEFEAGKETVSIAKLSDIDGSKAFTIVGRENEYGVRFHLIPDTITEPAILATWMIEKGCIQQADALLAALVPSPPGADQ